MGSTGPGIVVGDVIVVQVIGNDTPRKNEAARRATSAATTFARGKKLWKFHTIPRAGEFGVETWEERVVAHSRRGERLVDDGGRSRARLRLSAGRERRRTISGAASGPATACSAKASCVSMRRPASACGTSRSFTTACGTTICRPRRSFTTSRMDGKTIKAVTVLTKQGMNFVFDRVTGEPVWPIEERPVPTSMGVPGEKLSPTQPFPTKPAPYSNLGYHEEDVIDFTPAAQRRGDEDPRAVREGADVHAADAWSVPGIATKGTLVYPNFGGGSNWNGGAVDIETNVLFVPTRNTFMAVGLRKADPKLTDWHYTAAGGDGATPMRLPNGLPVNRPPWALVTATDMNRGEHIWSRSIGGAPDSIRNHPALKGLKLDFDNMGQISVRPSPLVTKTLLFLAESANIGGDPGGKMFRAYDKATRQSGRGDRVARENLGRADDVPAQRSANTLPIALSEQDHPAELVALALPRAGDPPVVAPPTPRPISSHSRESESNATPQQLALGADVYRQNCAACHGPRGEGVTGSNAPPLKTPTVAG